MAEASDGGSVPTKLLRDVLRRDAPHREMVAARLEAGVASMMLVVGIVMIFVRRSVETSLLFGAVVAPVLVYAMVVHRALGRGWWRPWLPLASTLVEIGGLGAASLIELRVNGAASVLTSPVLVLWGAVIVLTSVRMEPSICIVAGLVCAAFWGAFHLAFRGALPPLHVLAFGLPGAVVRAACMIVAGVLGAQMARWFVSRAEKALRDVREQDMFGKYLLGDSIAQGGMGEVLRATYCPEGGFERLVAVKRIREDLSVDRAFVDAFCREAQLCATLSHPNIVQVLDFGRFRGAFMLAMEHIDGLSLSRLLRAGRAGLELSAVTLLGAELAAALDYIHGRRAADGASLGLVHCDVNPPNVLVSRLGEVKLADFGVARAMGYLEPDGHFHGKPAYAAPEQTLGRPLDGRTDLFALGITLHEAVTGRRLFPGMVDFSSPPEIASPAASRKIPAPLETIIMSLLEVEPAKRPSTAREVRAALLALGGECAPYPEGERAFVRAVEACGPSAVADAPTRVEEGDETKSVAARTTTGSRSSSDC